MYEFLDYRTQDVMTREVHTIAPDACLAEAERLFEEHGWNGLPVVGEDGELRGLVTKLDVLRAFAYNAESTFPPFDVIMSHPVWSVMSRDVGTVRPRTPLTRVLDKLVDTGRKSLPVLDDDDRVIGIVAREDVLRGVRRAASEERAAGPI